MCYCTSSIQYIIIPTYMYMWSGAIILQLQRVFAHKFLASQYICLLIQGSGVTCGVLPLQVVSLSRGLDRCAALLKTLLSPDKQGTYIHCTCARVHHSTMDMPFCGRTYMYVTCVRTCILYIYMHHAPYYKVYKYQVLINYLNFRLCTWSL